MSDDEFFEFCLAHPDQRFERSADGKITIVPPASFNSDHQNLRVSSQLYYWAKRNGRGEASGPSTAFVLPTGATLSPDAAWTSHRRLTKVPAERLDKFPPVCPEFIVEVMSPSDRLSDAKKKMQEWLRAGVELGWLIHGREKTVYIYRAGETEPEKRVGLRKLAGEGPVAGFVLDLKGIWHD